MTVKFRNPPPRSLYVVCAILVAVTFTLVQVISLNAALTCSVLLSSVMAALIVFGSEPRLMPKTKPTVPDLTKADMIRLSVDCDMPWIDYDNGEIWTVERCREWLTREDRKDELCAQITALDHFMGRYKGDVGAFVRASQRQDRLRAEFRALKEEL